jgi:glucose 1-dehydrogenase
MGIMVKKRLVLIKPWSACIGERFQHAQRYKTGNGRVDQLEEIAVAIYFLADNTQSSFMTGQAMIVDGGATARLSTE